ncbi:hypothetical protein, partial [Vibrio parahaemolyticus]|uniref:hypothetical protein n=1 Tax=Vibrio parahaemolyticus TaxID=670 RepID=UPI000B45484F
GVMLNQKKSVVYGFSLFLRFVSFEFVGKLASLGAGNLESCLNQLSGKCEASAVGSIRTLNLGF